MLRRSDKLKLHSNRPSAVATALYEVFKYSEMSASCCRLTKISSLTWFPWHYVVQNSPPSYYQFYLQVSYTNQAQDLPFSPRLRPPTGGLVRRGRRKALVLTNNFCISTWSARLVVMNFFHFILSPVVSAASFRFLSLHFSMSSIRPRGGLPISLDRPKQQCLQ